MQTFFHLWWPFYLLYIIDTYRNWGSSQGLMSFGISFSVVGFRIPTLFISELPTCGRETKNYIIMEQIK